MDPSKKPPAPQEQNTTHPEVEKRPQRVPGEESSQVDTKQRDARTGKDKDGNEDHPRTERKVS